MKKILLLLLIAFISINLFGQYCTKWQISPSEQSVPCNGGTDYYADVTASGSCSYNYEVSDSWITVVSNSDGNLYYNVATNTSGYEQTGYIYIYDIIDGDILVATLEIDEDYCSYGCTDWAVNPSEQEISCSGGTDYSANVSAIGESCSYNAISEDSWITIDSYSGGTFYYNVATNPGTSSQTGYIDIYDVTDGNIWVAAIEIVQDGCINYSCTNWAITPYEQEVPCNGGTDYYADITASTTLPSCSYHCEVSDTWISIVSSTDGNLYYNVAANIYNYAQTGYIYIYDETDGNEWVATLEIDQDASCFICTNWSVAPSLQEVSYNGGTGYSANVNSSGSCAYNCISQNSWITVGNYSEGTFYYNIAVNPYKSEQIGYINISDEADGISDITTLEINQNGNPNGVGITEINPNNKINIFPNPSNDKITIEYMSINNIKDEMISIYDIEGQLIFKQPMQQKKTEINISEYVNGIYIVKISSEENVIIQKFVKE